MRFSICTTNYNCGDALEAHLDSVFSQLDSNDFEYLVVDNYSDDESWSILSSWAEDHPHMRAWRARCSMGAGRQLAYKRSSASHIVVVDTDVVYSKIFPRFLNAYWDSLPDDAVQAIYCGVFPRELWRSVGGRRDLNSHEDVDMWVRIWRRGKMHWYPVFTGENRKESVASGGTDFLSGRYSKRRKILRRLRRELDLWRTGDAFRLDLKSIVETNVVDFGLAPLQAVWFENRERIGLSRKLASFFRDVRIILEG